MCPTIAFAAKWVKLDADAGQIRRLFTFSLKVDISHQGGSLFRRSQLHFSKVIPLYRLVGLF